MTSLSDSAVIQSLLQLVSALFLTSADYLCRALPPLPCQHAVNLVPHQEANSDP